MTLLFTYIGCLGRSRCLRAPLHCQGTPLGPLHCQRTPLGPLHCQGTPLGPLHGPGTPLDLWNLGGVHIRDPLLLRENAAHSRVSVSGDLRKRPKLSGAHLMLTILVTIIMESERRLLQSGVGSTCTRWCGGLPTLRYAGAPNSSELTSSTPSDKGLIKTSKWPLLPNRLELK